MKKYERSNHITADITNAKKFHDAIVQTIDEYQRIHGLEVEVQYQHSFQVYSALVMGYKYEEKK